MAAILQDLVSLKAKNIFHDYAGWSMMILAMLLLWGEMTLLSKLFFEAPSEAPLILDDCGTRGKGGIAAMMSEPCAAGGGLGRVSHSGRLAEQVLFFSLKRSVPCSVSKSRLLSLAAR